jgi:hypothetical protein
MGEGNSYNSIEFIMAQAIINATNKGNEDPYFLETEKSLLSMFIFYLIVEKKESTSEVLNGINALLEQIDDIEDLHYLFMNIKDESLKEVYLNSIFYGEYKDFEESSIGMTKEEANEENGWLLNGTR